MNALKLVMEDYGPEQKVIRDVNSRLVVIVQNDRATEMARLIMAAPLLFTASRTIIGHFTGATATNEEVVALIAAVMAASKEG
jgi:mRNA-degrading endonuclease toxin of MazEF toxin-antitoxin module